MSLDSKIYESNHLVHVVVCKQVIFLEIQLSLLSNVAIEPSLKTSYLCVLNLLIHIDGFLDKRPLKCFTTFLLIHCAPELLLEENRASLTFQMS